jgi:hypothetical protein
VDEGIDQYSGCAIGRFHSYAGDEDDGDVVAELFPQS